MSNRNDVTGDKIITKPSSDYGNNYDRIFGKKDKQNVVPSSGLGEHGSTEEQSTSVRSTEPNVSVAVAGRQE